MHARHAPATAAMHVVRARETTPTPLTTHSHPGQPSRPGSTWKTRSVPFFTVTKSHAKSSDEDVFAPRARPETPVKCEIRLLIDTPRAGRAVPGPVSSE